MLIMLIMIMYDAGKWCFLVIAGCWFIHFLVGFVEEVVVLSSTVLLNRVATLIVESSLNCAVALYGFLVYVEYGIVVVVKYGIALFVVPAGFYWKN